MQPKNEPGFPTWTDPDDAPALPSAMLEQVETFQGDTFVKRGRGRPPTGNAKELVSLRLDRDVLATLREAGPGWQSQVNGLLRRVLDLGSGEASRAVVGVAAVSATAIASASVGAAGSPFGAAPIPEDRVETVRDSVRRTVVEVEKVVEAAPRPRRHSPKPRS